MVKHRLYIPVLMLVFISVSYHVEATNMALKLIGDPNSALEAPDHPSLDVDLGTQLTVEAWINRENTPPGQFVIVNKEDVYQLHLWMGVFEALVKPAGQPWDYIISNANIPVGEWTHVAMTYDGKLAQLYVNGELLKTDERWQGKLNDSPDTLKVGRRTRRGPTHSAFVGLIDEVRVSKTVRYNGNFEVPKHVFVPDEDTVALYHFDEAKDGVVQDFSQYGNHGELINKAELVEVDLVLVELVVESRSKLATTWANIKLRVE